VSWLECVPNLSEGRDSAWVESLAERVGRSADVRLLDHSSDEDHHRSVMTFVGRPGPLVDAMLELAAAAMEKIDLRRQTGVHPRVGALDVAPFVPLGSASMASAVEAAHELGQRLASELGIPTLLSRTLRRRFIRTDDASRWCAVADSKGW